MYAGFQVADDFPLSLLFFHLLIHLLQLFFQTHPFTLFSWTPFIFCLDPFFRSLGQVSVLSPHVTIKCVLVFALTVVIKIISTHSILLYLCTVISTLFALTERMFQMCLLSTSYTWGRSHPDNVSSITLTDMHYPEEILYKYSNMLCVFKVFLSEHQHKPRSRKLLLWTDSKYFKVVSHILFLPNSSLVFL